MALTKLGKHIEQCEFKNTDNSLDKDNVVGLATAKTLIPTKADLGNVSISSYKLLPPRHFAYVPDTSRRGYKMSMGFNTTEKTFLVSAISIVFKSKDENELDSDYLFMYFNRPEFDRYARFNSWGSTREAFLWEDMCDIVIDLPDIIIQRKIVSIYKSMLENLKAYEHGLADLKLTCDAFIEKLRKEIKGEKIDKFIEISDERNKDGVYTLEHLKGISIQKRFIETKADMIGVSILPYFIIKPGYFAFVTITSRNGEKISLAHNNTNDIYICSSSYIVFYVSKPNKILPEYLMIFLSRYEFDRYARFHSWGSTREAFSWEDMQEVQIPIPDINIQQNIVNIYNAYLLRKEIVDRLKKQINDICPILVKGATQES